MIIYQKNNYEWKTLFLKDLSGINRILIDMYLKDLI